MKNCLGCKYAKWARQKNNKLHPSGKGLCTYKYKIKPLPASMFWLGDQPTFCSLTINRKKELIEHCLCYEKK